MQNIKTMREFPLSNKPTLLLSPNLLASIKYAHKRVGNTEWSGFLLYKKVSGDFSHPDTLVFKADHFFPLDIGTPGYTNFDTDERVMEMWDMIPDAKDYMTAMIHTHHSMRSFFSGTDITELHDNVNNYPYYLSLIVNNDGDYCAKIAFVAEETSPSGLIVKEGLNCPENILSLAESDGSKVMVTMDCKVVWDVPTAFKDKITELLTKKNTYPNYTYNDERRFPTHGNSQGSFFPQEKREESFQKWKEKNQKKQEQVCLTDDNISLSIVRLVNLDLKTLDRTIGFNLKCQDAYYRSLPELQKAKYIDSMEDIYEDVLNSTFVMITKDNELTEEEVREISLALVRKINSVQFKDLSIVHRLNDILSCYIIEEPEIIESTKTKKDDDKDSPFYQDLTDQNNYYN